MASCEKCWRDSATERMFGPDGDDAYGKLLAERDCTPEEQAGPSGGRCGTCQRFTIHQYAKICMNPECGR